MKNKNIIAMPAGMGLMSDIALMEERKDLTKVSFPCKHEEIECENMWVRITEGDQKNGRGVLDNMPAYATYVKHEDVIDFAMREDDDIRPTFVCKLEKELTPDDVKGILASQVDMVDFADGEGFLPKGTNIDKWLEDNEHT